MEGWSALFLVASSVSLTSLLASCAGHPEGRIIRERETLRSAIRRSLEAMDRELDQLEAAAGDSGLEGKRAIYEEIGRLDDLKDELIEQAGRLREISQGEWNSARDQTLKVLDETKRYLARDRTGIAFKHG